MWRRRGPRPPRPGRLGPNPRDAHCDGLQNRLSLRAIMYPAPIEAYFAPKTIEEALECLAEAGDGAMFIAGGMSLMQAMKARLVAPRAAHRLERGGGAERPGEGAARRDRAPPHPLPRAHRDLGAPRCPAGDRGRGGNGGRPASTQCRHHRRQSLLELRCVLHAKRLPLPRRDACSCLTSRWRANRAY